MGGRLPLQEKGSNEPDHLHPFQKKERTVPRTPTVRFRAILQPIETAEERKRFSAGGKVASSRKKEDRNRGQTPQQPQERRTNLYEPEGSEQRSVPSRKVRRPQREPQRRSIAQYLCKGSHSSEKQGYGIQTSACTQRWIVVHRRTPSNHHLFEARKHAGSGDKQHRRHRDGENHTGGRRILRCNFRNTARSRCRSLPILDPGV